MSTVQVRNVLSPDGGVSDNLKPVTASAWVNFNGIGVVTIRDSHNVSSVTDNGIGDYTVNFQTQLQNSNYSYVVMIGGTSNAYLSRSIDDATARSVSGFRFLTANPSAVNLDPANVDVIVFGGQ